jgi:hypothetical protein
MARQSHLHLMSKLWCDAALYVPYAGRGPWRTYGSKMDEGNLSLFMVNVAYCLQADGRQRDPDFTTLDVKADCRGSTSVEETIQLLPEEPEPV